MDDDRVRELFHHAASDPPPAAFDASDIAVRARRAGRNRVLAGVATAAVVVIAVAIVVPAMLLGPRQVDTAAPTAQHGAPSRDGGRGVGPQIMGNAEACPVDPGLAAALADRLRLPGGARTVPVPGGCQAGGRGAAYHVAGSTVSAVLLPAGSRPRSAAPAEVRTAGSGATLVVSRVPATGVAPLASTLSAIADGLAARF